MRHFFSRVKVNQPILARVMAACKGGIDSKFPTKISNCKISLQILNDREIIAIVQLAKAKQRNNFLKKSLASPTLFLTAVGNAKKLFNELKQARSIHVGQSMNALGSTYVQTCMEQANISRFVEILSIGLVKTLGLKFLLQSGMNCTKAVDWIHQQTLKTVYSMLELVKTTKCVDPKVIEILEGNKRSAQKMISFLNAIEIGTTQLNSVMPYLQQLLESPISGRVLALLLESNLDVKLATADSRYLYNVAKFINFQVDTENVIVLMHARRVLYRLFEADEKLVEPVANLINNLVTSNKIKKPVYEVAKMFENCTESARVREMLIDVDFNSILIEVLENPIQGVLVGQFLSQTGLSIKELRLFSPDGKSINRLNSLELNSAFLTKLITAGLKVTDLGNIVRLASDKVVRDLAHIDQSGLDSIKSLIQLGARSNEIAILIGAGVTIDSDFCCEIEKNGILTYLKKTVIFKAGLAENKFTGKVDLIHSRFNTLNIFYEISDGSQIIHTPYYFNIIVPPGVVYHESLISVTRIPESFISQKTDARQLLSNLVNFQVWPEKPVNRKITVYYPISRQTQYEYAQPCFYALRGDKFIQLETTVINEKFLRSQGSTQGSCKLYCVTEIVPNETVALFLEPKIIHSGTEFKVNDV